MPRLCVTLLALLPLCACATVSTGIQPAGVPDRWTVTERDSPVNGGAERAERDATAQAQAFCARQGGAFMPVEGQYLARPVQQQLVGPTGYRLMFRCGAPDAADESGPAPWAPPP